jgi:zinc protease
MVLYIGNGKLRRGIVSALFAIVFGANAVTPVFAAKEFKTYTLKNGIRLILYPDRRIPMAALFVRYNVGARNEPPHKSGLAHLLEHMVFRADIPDHVMGDVTIYNSHGSNAGTSFDNTDYYAVEPSYRLKFAVWQARWRMTETNRFLDEHDLAKELPIVRNERRQRDETQAHDGAEQKMWEGLFPPGHPYRNRIIGSIEDLRSLKHSDARNFFDAWYAPNNAIVAMVGDFDPKEGEAMLETYFGSAPSSALNTPTALPSIVLSREMVIEHHESLGSKPRLYMAWHSPAKMTNGDATAQVFAELLSGMNASRFFDYIPEAATTMAIQQSMNAGSVFWIALEPRAGVSLESLKEKVDIVLDNLRYGPPEPKEVERAGRRLYRQTVEQWETLLGRAELLVETVGHLGDKHPIDQASEWFLKAKPEAIRAFVETTLKPEKRVVVFSRPVGSKVEQ